MTQTKTTRARATDKPAAKAVRSAKSSTKIDQVLKLLRREKGATLAELVNATKWLPHTTRAALTGLRKKGHDIGKTSRDGVTAYILAG